MNRKQLSFLSLMLTLVIMALNLLGCDGSGPSSVPDRTETEAPASDLGLIWVDEFDGTTLDASKWNIETGYGNSGWGNNEWQLYTGDEQNVRVENGNLVITARCDSGNCGQRDGSITSARINTKNKFSFRYGKIQARIKPPTGMGMWSAFWMLGSNFDAVGWPACGEIDIMELHFLHSDDHTTHAAMHWWDEGAAVPGWTYDSDYLTLGSSLGDDYHIYELEWDESRVVAKIDGQAYFYRAISPSTMEEFYNDFFIILNVAVGGNLGGAPNATTTWPQEMTVDWVKVYSDNVPAPPPSGTTAGIYSETHTAPTIPYSGIINSSDWSGHQANADEADLSRQTPDGKNVLAVEYTNNTGPEDWSGIYFDFGAADFTPYTTLSFLLDSSNMRDFDDMEVALEDGGRNKAPVRLAAYTPIAVDGWMKYEIPLNHFSSADYDNVAYLGFSSPLDELGSLQSGTLYFDDIVLDVGCVNTGDLLLNSEYYAEDAAFAAVNVSDVCSAQSDVIVVIDNGRESINLEVSLDDNGIGSSEFYFGATDDADDSIAVSNGDIVRASFTDSNSNYLTDSANIEAAGIRDLPGDDPVADGFVYVYATDASTVIDLDDGGVDYAVVDTWSSGSVHNNAYAGDTSYNPVFSVFPGTGWGVAAGAVAFSGFSSGFTTGYETLHFKFKGNYASVLVKFANAVAGPEQEIEYQQASANVTDLGDGWFGYSIRLSDFTVLDTATEFAILNFGSDPYYLTDIYFD